MDRAISQIECVLQPSRKHVLDSAIGGGEYRAAKKAMIAVKWMTVKNIKKLFRQLFPHFGSMSVLRCGYPIPPVDVKSPYYLLF